MPNRTNNHKRKGSKKPFSKAQVKQIKKISETSGERKFIDQSESDTSIVASASFNMVIGMPAQGLDNDDRIGDKIRLASIRFKGNLKLSASATEGATIRMLVLRVPSTNVDGTAPIADFTGLKPNDFLPLQTPYSYKVLKDFTINIGVGAINSKLVKISLMDKDVVTFDGTGVNDISNHKYYFLGLTDHATINELSMLANTRLTYYDN